MSAARLHLASGLSVAETGTAYWWWHYHHPGGWPVLGTLSAAVALLWPLAALAVVFGLRGTGACVVPYKTLMRWRRAHDRPGIPAWLRRAVYAADRHACLRCGAVADLQVDHVRPWSCGGLSCLWNLATLCGPCNRVKSNYWAWPSGSVTYRSFPGSADQATAAAILAAELRARRNPARWLRVAWTLR